jgi:hypothetical protein
MRRQSRICVLLLILIAGGRAPGGEPQGCEPPEQDFLRRLHPVGGWHPYGGGLLHWWDPCCFPRGGTPDDYCRKPLPRVCWPPYPPFYVWGPVGSCGPRSPCARVGTQPPY